MCWFVNHNVVLSYWPICNFVFVLVVVIISLTHLLSLICFCYNWLFLVVLSQYVNIVTIWIADNNQTYQENNVLLSIFYLNLNKPHLISIYSNNFKNGLKLIISKSVILLSLLFFNITLKKLKHSYWLIISNQIKNLLYVIYFFV